MSVFNVPIENYILAKQTPPKHHTWHRGTWSRRIIWNVGMRKTATQQGPESFVYSRMRHLKVPVGEGPAGSIPSTPIHNHSRKNLSRHVLHMPDLKVLVREGTDRSIPSEIFDYLTCTRHVVTVCYEPFQSDWSARRHHRRRNAHLCSETITETVGEPAPHSHSVRYGCDVATHCSVLQCVAVCCCVLLCVAVCCCVL